VISSPTDDFDPTFFWENGFQIIRSVIPREITGPIFKFLHNSVENSLDSINEELNEAGLNSLIDNLQFFRKLNFDDFSPKCQHILSGHFPLDVRLSDKLIAIARCKSLQNILRKVLDSQELFLHMPPAARFILPNNTKAGVPVHQDASYNKHMSNFITCWTPLVETDEKCGGVEVFWGSGNLGEIEVEQTDFWLEGLPKDEYETYYENMKPGDILLLNPNVLHASRPNTSERIRISIDFRFFGKNGNSSKHHLNLNTNELLEPLSVD
jgi:hypothetical protein